MKTSSDSKTHMQTFCVDFLSFCLLFLVSGFTGLKVQYVILTASGWNVFCSPNSKYWRVVSTAPSFSDSTLMRVARLMTLFRSGRIYDLWPSSFTGFHGCNTLCFPPIGFVKLQLNHWCHMDYFNDVLTTFLRRDRGRILAVYGRSDLSDFT